LRAFFLFRSFPFLYCFFLLISQQKQEILTPITNISLTRRWIQEKSFGVRFFRAKQSDEKLILFHQRAPAEPLFLFPLFPARLPL
jgi:hypothetical protein